MKARRTWRKLHLAVDPGTGMIMVSTLTENDAGDPSLVALLLDRIDAEIGSVTAHGAYDGAPAYDVCRSNTRGWHSCNQPAPCDGGIQR